MKKYISLALTTALLSVAQLSCQNNLNVDPTDQYSETTFWRTQADAMAGLSGCYNALYDCITWFYETDMITSNGMPYNESNGTNAIGMGAHTPITGLITARWTQGYKGVGRTNTFLAKIGGVSGMTDDLKNRTTGEAKFLRAFYYQGLVDTYGGVPLITDQPDLATQGLLPRNTKEEVVAQILKDLDEAIPVLPDAYTSGSDLGRVTKGAAIALKARVLLYNSRWAEAAAAAKSLIDRKTYTLFPNYRNLFLLANERNQEVVFNVEYQSPRFLNNLDYDSYVLNRPAPARNLADVYLMTDGKTKEESPLYDPAKPFENRDPRLLQTMYTVGYKFNGRVTTAANVVTTGFGLKKYTNFTDNEALPAPASNTNQINIILIRYAEVLLTYAEAQNEAAGPDATVYEAMNLVRQRAGMPVLTAGLTQAAMRSLIRRERRVELAFEGLYYSDVKRWKTIETENNGPVLNYLNQVVVQRTFNKDRDYLWPVPSTQIQINPGLKQNPNWF